MRDIALLAVACLFFGGFDMSPGRAQTAASQGEAERYIIKSENEWAESVATNDSSVVERILADDFIWVLDGEVLDKKAAVRLAKSGPGDFVSNHTDYVHVRFFGISVTVHLIQRISR